mmetsp:Transcript_151881/g.487400  ORF Transcript_151881/g.487400 Transcript_151881/m.487400 type:complete len:889 (+) Transcript_151881:88-2754(+)
MLRSLLCVALLASVVAGPADRPRHANFAESDDQLCEGGAGCSTHLLQLSATHQQKEVSTRHRDRILSQLAALRTAGSTTDARADGDPVGDAATLAKISEEAAVCKPDESVWGCPNPVGCNEEVYRKQMQIGGIVGTAMIMAFCAFIGTREIKIAAGGDLEELGMKESLQVEDFTETAKGLRSVGEEELAKHSRQGDLWLAIDGVVCDLTEFATLHPGGEQILMEHAGREAGEAFHEVGHSQFAISQVRANAVAMLVTTEENGVAGGVVAGKSWFGRLFTKEDFGGYNFHKILGILALAQYVLRTCLIFSGFRIPNADQAWFGPDYFSLVSVWMLAALQFTSFKFIVPRNRILGQPMIWQEWRMHNLIFVMRHVLIFTIRWYVWHSGMGVHGSATCTLLMYGVLFTQLKTVDMATDWLREDKHESLTATWPFWKGCPPWVEQFIKFYYTIAQFQATLLALTGSSYLFMNIMVIFPFQWASLMMTLVRKNIISTAAYHASYLWSLMQVVFLTMLIHESLFLEGWAVWVMLYFVRRQGLNKYGLWIGMMVPSFSKDAVPEFYANNENLMKWSIPMVWALCALGQYLFQGRALEKRARRYLENRPKSLELIQKEKVGDSMMLLRFQLPTGFTSGLSPGQHIRVHCPNASKGRPTWNGRANAEDIPETLSRSYTPVSAPDDPTLDILVKVYPPNAAAGFPDGGRGSTFLTDALEVGMQVPVSGPHGFKVYHGDGRFLVGAQFKQIRRVAALVGGSGVTPAMATLRELRAEARAAGPNVKGGANSELVTDVAVLHVTHKAEDALPDSWYEPANEADSVVACRVKNLATAGATGAKSPQARASARREQLQGAIAETFPAAADDVVVLVCGPQAFVNELCLPLLKELGFQNVITMW